MKSIYCLTAFALLAVCTDVLEAGVWGDKCKPSGCCDTVDCVPCNMVCCPEVKVVKEANHCWETECVPVCIPKVRCPLFNIFRKDDCCDPCAQSACGQPLDGLCGKVRMVKKLKKVEYECDKCVCEWKIRCVQGCGKSCDDYCAPHGCCPIR